MANFQRGRLIDEDNTSIAARGLLTLNNGTSSKTTSNNNISHEKQLHKISHSGQPELVILQGKTLTLKSESQPNDITESVEMFLDVHEGQGQQQGKEVLSVRIDRSSGKPDIQIIGTEEASSSNERDVQPIEKVKDQSKTEKFDEEEIFTMVTAVIKKRPDISTNKYMSLFKMSEVTAVHKDDNISISGSLKAVNTIHEGLQVLYRNIDNEEHLSLVNGEHSEDLSDDQAELSPDISDEIMEADKNEIFITSASCESTKRNSVLFANCYKCVICDKKFENVQDFVEHGLEVHPEEYTDKAAALKNFKCSQCGKIFLTRQSLIQHTEEVHGPNTCPLCGKEFALKRYLSMHMKRHSEGNKKHACEVCGRKFLERYKLKLHMESHKASSEKTLPHSCLVCKRQFYNKATLDDHMNTHTGNRPFVCSICNNSFSHRIGLKRHLVTHEKTKPFTCQICQKTFAFKAKLKEHLIIHTGEEKYVCPNCGKIFTTSASRKRHIENCVNRKKSSEQMTAEGGEAVFMCGICSLVFDTLEKASIHAASHET